MSLSEPLGQAPLRAPAAADGGAGFVLFVGPMKSGTTWIHDYLAARPGVRLPARVKETFFFDRLYDRGLGWYAGLFDDGRPAPGRPAPRDIAATPACEVAPSLFHAAEAPQRVARHFPRATIVFTLRDPVRRALSHYQHLRRHGYTRQRLPEALEAFPAILEASRYEHHIARWQAALPQARFVTLRLEDLRADPTAFAAGLCGLFDLPPGDPAELSLPPRNVAGAPRSFHLARLGRRAAYLLRDAGLHAPVEAAKRLGLKRLFFGADGSLRSDAGPTPAEIAALRRRLGQDG